LRAEAEIKALSENIISAEEMVSNALRDEDVALAANALSKKVLGGRKKSNSMKLSESEIDSFARDMLVRDVKDKELRNANVEKEKLREKDIMLTLGKKWETGNRMMRLRQAIYFGHHNLARQCAARLLQEWGLMVLARRKFQEEERVNEERRRVVVAEMMQNLWRCHKSKKRVREIRRRQSEERRLILDFHARVLQRTVRARQAKLRAEALRRDRNERLMERGMRQLQRLFRRKQKKAQRIKSQRSEAAVKIQGCYRGVEARGRVGGLRQVRATEDAAAVRIQSLTRQREAGKLTGELRVIMIKRNTAAVHIQCVARQRQAEQVRTKRIKARDDLREEKAIVLQSAQRVKRAQAVTTTARHTKRNETAAKAIQVRNRIQVVLRSSFAGLVWTGLGMIGSSLSG